MDFRWISDGRPAVRSASVTVRESVSSIGCMLDLLGIAGLGAADTDTNIDICGGICGGARGIRAGKVPGCWREHRSGRTQSTARVQYSGLDRL